jgi:hypothetical protein
MLRFARTSAQTLWRWNFFLLVLRQRTGRPDHRGRLPSEGWSMFQLPSAGAQTLWRRRDFFFVLVLHQRTGRPDDRGRLP